MSDRAVAISESEQLLMEEMPRDENEKKEHNLEKIIQMDTWREILYDMVAKREINPWDIDVVVVAGKYLGRIKEMQMDDLRIPANLILAAAILLRFKSDMINLDEPAQMVLDDFDSVGEGEIPQLELRARIPPKRRVTLDELVDAVENVFEEQKKHMERVEKRAAMKTEIAPLEIKMNEFNIEHGINSVLEKIKTRLDREGLVTFSNLLDNRNRVEIIYTFIPLLFLAQEGKVHLRQDPFFGEIFINLNGKEEKKEKKEKLN
ncbi:MAG: segregation/condensation protein A [Candidatus Micrarchaeota archaeon]